MRALFRYRNIFFATLFACALVYAAYQESHKNIPPQTASVAVVEVARVAHAPKDTDGDGLRDWEEELHGTNALVPDPQNIVSETTRTNELPEIPQTVTDRLTHSAFGSYLSNRNGEALSAEDQTRLATEAARVAQQQLTDILYSVGDLTILTVNDPETLSEYGTTILRIITAQTTPQDNELFILQRALQADNPELLKPLDPLQAGYDTLIKNLSAQAVPPALVNEHLALLNASVAIHNDIVAMRNVFEDGVPALVRVQRYLDDVELLKASIESLVAEVIEQGGTFDVSGIDGKMPGSGF